MGLVGETDKEINSTMSGIGAHAAGIICPEAEKKSV